MIFAGSDNSIVKSSRDTLRVYYGETPPYSVTFKDIAFDHTISMAENLYIYGLKDSKIEALNCYLIFSTRSCDKSRLTEYRRLKQDEMDLKELRGNISMLSHFTALGNPCDFRILSQSQKYANYLEDSIRERKEEILRAVAK